MSNTNINYTEKITDIYELLNADKPSLIEYIELNKGYRVESKSLFSLAIEQLEKLLNLKLVSVHPTSDKTVIATYQFLGADLN